MNYSLYEISTQDDTAKKLTSQILKEDMNFRGMNKIKFYVLIFLLFEESKLLYIATLLLGFD